MVEHEHFNDEGNSDHGVGARRQGLPAPENGGVGLHFVVQGTCLFHRTDSTTQPAMMEEGQNK